MARESNNGRELKGQMMRNSPVNIVSMILYCTMMYLRHTYAVHTRASSSYEVQDAKLRSLLLGVVQLATPSYPVSRDDGGHRAMDSFGAGLRSLPGPFVAGRGTRLSAPRSLTEGCDGRLRPGYVLNPGGGGGGGVHVELQSSLGVD